MIDVLWDIGAYLCALGGIAAMEFHTTGLFVHIVVNAGLGCWVFAAGLDFYSWLRRRRAR